MSTTTTTTTTTTTAKDTTTCGMVMKSSHAVLCRFDLSPIPLVRIDDKNDRVGNSSPCSSCWELEECLEQCLDEEEEEEEETDGEKEKEKLPPLLYLARPDVGFLNCQRPAVRSKETILGILEEDECNVPIDLYTWTRITAPEATTTLPQACCCTCQAPHGSWKRTALSHVAEPPPLPTTTTTTTDSSSCLSREEQQERTASKTPREVHWVDLRKTAVSTVDSDNDHFQKMTCASVTHFLRSLLGSSLEASPWVNNDALDDDDDDDSKNKNRPTTATPPPLGHAADCVIVVLDQVPDELLEYRVSDACPSWSLYAAANLQLPVDTTTTTTTNGGDVSFFVPPWISCSITKQGDSSSRMKQQPAQALVYRRLPPRDRLSAIHPQTKEMADQACLWETRIIYPKDDDDEKDVDKPQTPYYDYRLVSSPYIDPYTEFPALQALVQPDNLATLQREAARIPQWTAWPERQHYQVKKTKHTSSNDDDDDDDDDDEDDDGDAPWHVFPLCYCFPAHDVQQRKWIPLTTAYCVDTTRLLQQVLGDTLRTALFSRLDPGAVLQAHTGWQDLANHVYRVHLPLVVPHDNPTDSSNSNNNNKNAGLCGTWVDGCVETHVVGRLQAFDDSKTHRAFNYSPDQHRVVLILDLVRPADLPPGTAVGGHSDELDKFIEQMGGGGNSSNAGTGS